MNIEDIKELTEHQINSICAEFVGWKKFGLKESGEHNGWHSPAGFYSSLAFHPFSRMEDAMMLIEKLFESRWILFSLKTGWNTLKQEFEGFHCTLLNVDTGASREWQALTASLAISCAALQAIRGK